MADALSRELFVKPDEGDGVLSAEEEEQLRSVMAAVAKGRETGGGAETSNGVDGGKR